MIKNIFLGQNDFPKILSQKKIQRKIWVLGEIPENPGNLEAKTREVPNISEMFSKTQNVLWNFFWDKTFENLIFSKTSFLMVIYHHCVEGINLRGSLTPSEWFRLPTEKSKFSEFWGGFGANSGNLRNFKVNFERNMEISSFRPGPRTIPRGLGTPSHKSLLHNDAKQSLKTIF